MAVETSELIFKYSSALSCHLFFCEQQYLWLRDSDGKEKVIRKNKPPIQPQPVVIVAVAIVSPSPFASSYSNNRSTTAPLSNSENEGEKRGEKEMKRKR
ncbi:hypothetical protein QYF36_026908 [Acer negundo]|nr:hypothetical protein QYF36_026908 [Acer negundo]